MNTCSLFFNRSYCLGKIYFLKWLQSLTTSLRDTQLRDTNHPWPVTSIACNRISQEKTGLSSTRFRKRNKKGVQGMNGDWVHLALDLAFKRIPWYMVYVQCDV